jgi:hypothetical protein
VINASSDGGVHSSILRGVDDTWSMSSGDGDSCVGNNEEGLNGSHSGSGVESPLSFV